MNKKQLILIVGKTNINDNVRTAEMREKIKGVALQLIDLGYDPVRVVVNGSEDDIDLKYIT